MSIKSIVSFVFILLILGLLFLAIRAILPMFGFPEPVNYVIWILMIVCFLLAIGNWFGFIKWDNKSPPPG